MAAQESKPVYNRGSKHPRDALRLLELVPPEHRLPGLLFFALELILGPMVYFGNDTVRIAAILAMVIVSGIFLTRFFPKTKPPKKEKKASISSEDLELLKAQLPKTGQEINTAEDPELRRELENMINSLQSIQKKGCPLFTKKAFEKYNEVRAYISELLNARLVISSQEEVSEVLKFMFCEIDAIKNIEAVSYDEIKEWREDWWMEHYLKIHKVAIAEGRSIKRIFILKSRDEYEFARQIFDKMKTQGIQVATVFESIFSSNDLQDAGNCLIFYNSERKPIYALQARHTKEGKFKEAIVFGDEQYITPLVSSYERIESNAKPY